MTQAKKKSEQASHVPPRNEIPADCKWRLEDIYADDSAWQKDFDYLKTSFGEISRYKGRLAESAELLLACLKARDAYGIIGGKLYSYARMRRDENSSDAKYQAMTGKIEALMADIGGATAFIEPEIIAIADETIKHFCNKEKDLGEYAFYFKNLAKQKEHVLSPAEEEILSRVSEVTQTPENVYNMLSHADMKFPTIKDEEDNEVQLSEGRYRSFIMSENRRVRAEAFKGLFGTYNQYRNTFAATLGGNVKKNVFYAKTRKYNSTIESALEGDNVPIAVYDNLINTVNRNLEPLHRYIALKKRLLGLDEIHMYDLYTPVVRDVKFTVQYDEAVKLVQAGLEPLGAEYLDALKKGLNSGWIDVYENQGKQTGAYAWGVYGVHPYVLLNYNNRYDDVSTLAHEMGHALHSYYSHSNQPYATASYTIFTAEVASTTNEVLLLDYMMKITGDQQKKLYLINQYLEAVRATVYRQTMFAEFERIIYQRAEEGDVLTADMLDALWHELNAKYYGPEIIVDKEIDIEWARIPHFYWCFYVYQYVTGYSAATALAEQILKEGKPAQDRYLSFLKSGGSDYPLNILKQAGVNMSSPEPVEITLKKFSSMLDQLDNLLGYNS